MSNKRNRIGLYAKLRIGFVTLNEKSDKRVFKFLTKKKYTFSKKELKIGVKNAFEYNVNVDSIEEAYKLKKKIVRLT